MKIRTFIIMFACLAMLASCSLKSNEDKARELIEPEIRAHLIKPESYEFAQMQLDSCFTDNAEYNPEVAAFTIKLAKIYKDYKDYLEEAERAESQMDIYVPSFDYYDAHIKHQHEKYKAETEKAQRKASAAKEEIFKLYKDNKKILEDLNAGKHEFMGWRAICSYRAETAGGLKTMGNVLFFLNKDLTEITHRFSEEDIMLIQDAGVEDIQYELGDELKEFFANQK